MPNCPSCGTQNLSEDHAYCFKCGYNFTGATGQLKPNTVLEGRYLIVDILGRGGMGAVYKALDQRLNNMPIAIKEMSTNAVGQGNLQAAVGSFRKEAAMLIGLRHPALPRITDFFSHGEDRWYLVMDYIEGETLNEILERRGPIPEVEVLDWAKQLCLILDYLHNQKPPVIFRDLKPANIMLTPEGKIKLIDFGIARHFKHGLTSDTKAYGSAGYAPPEQHGDKQTDARSDIYALGATIHHLLTGKDPVKNPFVFEPPGKIFSVSPELESAVLKAVELKPESRPDSIKQMLLLLLVSDDNRVNITEPLQSDKQMGAINKSDGFKQIVIEDSQPKKGFPLPFEGFNETEKIESFSVYQQDQILNTSSAIKKKPTICKNIKRKFVVLGILLLLGVGWYGLSHLKSDSHKAVEKVKPSVVVSSGNEEPKSESPQSQPQPQSQSQSQSQSQQQSQPIDKDTLSEPLCGAALNGNIGEVKSLLALGANPNARVGNNLTPLRQATLHEHIDVVKVLLAAGADPNSADALYTAAQCTPEQCNTIPETVKILLDAGANPNKNICYGFTPLFAAATSGNLGVVKLLLDKGANINSRITESANSMSSLKEGDDVLKAAVVAEKKDMVRLLLEAGANPNTKNSLGETSLTYAQKNGYAEIVNILIGPTK